MDNLKHWADSRVESMYDKTLLGLETAAIKRNIAAGSTILDAGCGDGEATVEYAKLGQVEAFDSSTERLEMALRRRLQGIWFFKHDVLDPLERKFDVAVSQRLLINLGSWERQKKALLNLAGVAPRVILSEGSVNGANALNELRGLYGLPPIPIPEHNVFIRDEDLLDLGARPIKALGAYYFITRGIQPALTNSFHWASAFNRISAGVELDAERYARVKVWVYEK